MNLIFEPWIPALRINGCRELFSLHDFFSQAHQIRDLAVKPHERIALMRLLICLTQASLNGPADEGEWEACQSHIQSRVLDYLKQWKTSFELMGEGVRFLQLPNLKPGKESDEGNASTKLDLALATGNNSTLFDNLAGVDRSLAVARSALNLLTFQCFAPGGRIGIAKWNGRDTAGSGSSNHAPCTPSSMVHSLVLGSTLLDTIHRNLLTRDDVANYYGPDRWGKPIWEQPVDSADDRLALRNAGMTYLGRLVPLSRSIRLSDDQVSVLLANGLDYPIFPAFREATATVVNRKDELALLPASTSRSLWRQLGAVSVIRRAAAEPVRGPLALNHLPAASETTLWVGALVTDKAKIEDVVESTYSLPAGLFTEFGRLAYEKAVAFSEERESQLIQAVKIYASTLKVVSPANDRARQYYWTSVEQHLSALFDLARNTDLIADLPGSAWGRAIQEAAFSAYERFCSRQTSRQIQAYALGLRKLTFVAKSTKPITTLHE